MTDMAGGGGEGGKKTAPPNDQLVRYTFERRIERHDIHDEPQRGSGVSIARVGAIVVGYGGDMTERPPQKRSHWVEEGCRWLTVSATGDVTTQYSGVDEENGAGPLKERPDAEGMFLWGGAEGQRVAPTLANRWLGWREQMGNESNPYKNRSAWKQGSRRSNRGEASI